MGKVIGAILLILLLGGGSYIYFSYYNSYDKGSREGILYSFSRKGDVFKTYEGVMLQPGLRPSRTGGLNTNEFHFSVTDEAIADSLDKCIGKQIMVHYNQYRKSLPWRGENNNNDNKDKGQYIVDKVENVKEANNAYNNF